MRPDAIIKTLEDAGFEARYVGGCVRDTLLDRPIHDWDIASQALPEDVLRLFPHCVPTGIRHGTVTVLLDGVSAEVTTYRLDGAYHDGRHPDGVRFVRSLAEDLARRDFTINAMAMDESGAVTDLFGGREDLSRRVIRCVGEPETRFREDALRMLRAYRFAAQLGFSLDAQTQAAIRRCALPKTPEARWTAAKLRCPAFDPAAFRLPAKLCRLIELTAQTWREGRTEAEWKRLIAEHGWETAHLQADLQRTDTVRQIELRGDCVTLRQLAVTGADFPTLCGKDVGRMLHLLLVYALEHPDQNTKTQLLAAAPSLWQEENKIQG